MYLKDFISNVVFPNKFSEDPILLFLLNIPPHFLLLLGIGEAGGLTVRMVEGDSGGNVGTRNGSEDGGRDGGRIVAVGEEDGSSDSGGTAVGGREDE